MGEGPTTPHVSRYRGRVSDDPADLRLDAPVFQRNCPPILVALAPLLADRRGVVLEIGSGTGQHAAAFRLGFPALDWIASDPDPDHRASILAWADALGLPRRPVLDLDAAKDWAAAPDIAIHAPLTAVISLNVIHIAPFRVAEGILRGAGRALGPGGLLIFYGPFREHGAHTGDGNRVFDARLRADNPEWGLRDVDDITGLAEAAGLVPAAFVPMPANNRLLVFRHG